MGLYSNEWQLTTKCGQNIRAILGCDDFLFLFLFLFFTLSVIYYWTDAPQHDIYLIIISHSFSALLNNELYFLRYQKHINAMQPMSGQLDDWKYPNTRNRRPLVV